MRCTRMLCLQRFEVGSKPSLVLRDASLALRSSHGTVLAKHRTFRFPLAVDKTAYRHVLVNSQHHVAISQAYHLIAETVRGP